MLKTCQLPQGIGGDSDNEISEMILTASIELCHIPFGQYNDKIDKLVITDKTTSK